MQLSCCNAKGPSACGLIPDFAYQPNNDVIRVKYYGSSEAEIRLPNKKRVEVKQQTNYPENGQVSLTLNPEKESTFTLALRIPAWSSQSRVFVNGEPVNGVLPGAYLPINRQWKKNDVVTIELDMCAHLVTQNNMQAIVRGPIVLARDSRFKDGFVDETAVIAATDGIVNLMPVQSPAFPLMAFTAQFVLGKDL